MPQIIHEIQIASFMIKVIYTKGNILPTLDCDYNISEWKFNVSRVFKEYDEIMASCVVVSSIEFNNEPLGITPSWIIHRKSQVLSVIFHLPYPQYRA